MTRLWLSVLATAVCLSSRADAAPDASGWLPGSGQVGAAIATGVPFLVMSEVSLGVTDYAALGVLGGTTPIVSGFGFRARGALPVTEHSCILLSLPVVYYPRAGDTPTWWLTRPAALFGGDIGRVSLAGGAGWVGIARHDAIFGRQDFVGTSGGYAPTLRQRQGAWWWSLNGLTTVGVSDRTELFADATLVFRGARLAGAEWVGGPPIIVFLGVSTTL